MWNSSCDKEDCIFNMDGTCLNLEACDGTPIYHIEEKSIEKLDFKIDFTDFDFLDEEDVEINETINNINL